MQDAVTPAAGGARPCWWVAPAPGTCQTPTQLVLHIERVVPPAAGSVVDVTCEAS